MFILHSFIQEVFVIAETILDTKDTGVKKTDTNTCPHKTYIIVERETISQINNIYGVGHE